jgi:hypothetical protein
MEEGALLVTRARRGGYEPLAAGGALADDVACVAYADSGRRLARALALVSGEAVRRHATDLGCVAWVEGHTPRRGEGEAQAWGVGREAGLGGDVGQAQEGRGGESRGRGAVALGVSRVLRG